MEAAAAMEAAGDGAWRERAQQLARDLELLHEDSRALRRALGDAAADLAFQQECQAAMVDKLAEARLRRLHEFLRPPDGAKTLFMEATKRSARVAHPTMPRRELRALLAARWEALAADERDDWEARFREYAGRQESEVPAGGRKRPAPKLAVKTTAPSKRKSAADEPAAATPRKRKAAAATASSPSPSPSTPTKKRAKASKATAASDSSKAEDPASGASDPGTPRSASKGGRGSKPSPRKKAAAAKATTSPATKSSKAASTNKARSPAAKTPAATKKTKKAPAAAKKAPKKKAQDGDGDRGDGQKKRLASRDYSASDEDDDEEEEDDDDDENESLSGGSPSEDDSDDNMAQLPTGAFG